MKIADILFDRHWMAKFVYGSLVTPTGIHNHFRNDQTQNIFSLDSTRTDRT